MLLRTFLTGLCFHASKMTNLLILEWKKMKLWVDRYGYLETHNQLLLLHTALKLERTASKCRAVACQQVSTS